MKTDRTKRTPTTINTSNRILSKSDEIIQTHPMTLQATDTTLYGNHLTVHHICYYRDVHHTQSPQLIYSNLTKLNKHIHQEE